MNQELGIFGLIINHGRPRCGTCETGIQGGKVNGPVIRREEVICVRVVARQEGSC